MKCPKCQNNMEQVSICGIEIDRCSRCRGIWFDQMEQDQIQCARGSYKADIGHRAIGEYYNSVRDIKCPRCSVPMAQEELKRGRIAIQVETCPQCGGSYFDAGEYRSFAEPSMLEFFTGLIGRFQKKVNTDND